MSIIINIYYTSRHHASAYMERIMSLREKYDLRMRVERYIPAEENTADRKFIRE